MGFPILPRVASRKFLIDVIDFRRGKVAMQFATLFDQEIIDSTIKSDRWQRLPVLQHEMNYRQLSGGQSQVVDGTADEIGQVRQVGYCGMARGANAPGMPAYVCIPEDYRRHMGFYEHAAFLSSRHNALDAGGDPSLGNYRVPDFNPPKDVALPRVENRRELLGQLDSFQRSISTEPQYANLDAVQRQAFELVCGSKAREAFDLTQEPDALRDRYGRHAYGQSALLARRLVERGVTFVTINLYEKDVDWWDDHYTIEKNLRKRLPLYDEALSTLIEDIHARDLHDKVLVAAFGEFGRAPRIDQYAGRGHWPKAMHAVLSGGGIKPGQIVGSTTKNGGEPSDRALGPGDLLATIYHAMGIDHRQPIIDRQNRPIPILPDGEPIRELL